MTEQPTVQDVLQYSDIAELINAVVIASNRGVYSNIELNHFGPVVQRASAFMSLLQSKLSATNDGAAVEGENTLNIAQSEQPAATENVEPKTKTRKRKG